MVTVQKDMVREPAAESTSKAFFRPSNCTCMWHFGMNRQRISAKDHTTECLQSCAAVNMLLQKAKLYAILTSLVCDALLSAFTYRTLML